MIIVQGAFTISPNHDRPLQIGERLEEDKEEKEEEEEEEEKEEEGKVRWRIRLCKYYEAGFATVWRKQ